MLREAVRVMLREVMEAEVSAAAGADWYERSDERVAQRNGYRGREWDTGWGRSSWRIPSCGRVRCGRLLRYVSRGEPNINIEMVRRGAAAPYFFNGDEGRYAAQLYSLAVPARARTQARGVRARATALGSDAAVDAMVSTLEAV